MTDALIRPYVNAEAHLLFEEGVQHEGHAQNVLVEIDASERLTGLPELVVEGLGDEDARALLDSLLLASLDARVRDQIVSETRGLPLALIELPRGLKAAELTREEPLEEPFRLAASVEREFLRRLAGLPLSTRRALLVAATSGNRTMPQATA